MDLTPHQDEPGDPSRERLGLTYEQLLAIVAEAAHAHTTAEWLTFCAQHNIPASEVPDLIDIPTDPYVTEVA